MTPTLPVPKTLRPDLIQRIEALPEEELPLVNELLLDAEKERLWREISTEAETERLSGRWENLAEIIQTSRARWRFSRSVCPNNSDNEMLCC